MSVYLHLRSTSMPFRKNNKLGAQKLLKRSLDKQPITFKGYEGHREAVKSVPNWQERLRDFVEKMIEESKTVGG